MSCVASTGGYTGDDVRDVMLAAVEQRFGTELPGQPIEWLPDNGSAYIALDTRRFAASLHLVPLNTPARSPQSNGMAESFVKTAEATTSPGCPSRTRQRPWRIWLWPSSITTNIIRTARCITAHRPLIAPF